MVGVNAADNLPAGLAVRANASPYRNLVLCYHGISETWPCELGVRPTELERQLELLLDHGYRGGTFDSVVSGEASGKTLAVTFDDACRSVFHKARPILDKLGLPGSVFAPTKFIDSDEPMAWPGVSEWASGPHAEELLPMSWTQLRDLAANGWQIGSHTRSHPRLPELSDDELETELRGSREDCEAGLGSSCRSVAYPYGAVDARVVRAATAAGYRTGAVLSRRLPPAEELRYPRIGVYRFDSMSRFRVKVSPNVRRLRMRVDSHRPAH